MTKVYHLREARAFARRAMEMGAALISPNVVKWDISGWCENPREFEIASKIDPREDFRDDRAIAVIMVVKCRQCAPCLSMRKAQWSARAEIECQQSFRTWLVTLTLNADEQLKALYRAQTHNAKQGKSWHALAKPRPGEAPELYADRNRRAQFAALHRAISPELTRWLKRIRKESGARLRYLLVVEAHKSGLPHYHVLIHENNNAQEIRKRTLQGQWKLGFSNCKLVDDKAARYVCKYLNKAAEARVRASRAYGKENESSGTSKATF